MLLARESTLDKIHNTIQYRILSTKRLVNFSEIDKSKQTSLRYWIIMALLTTTQSLTLH